MFWRILDIDFLPIVFDECSCRSIRRAKCQPILAKWRRVNTSLLGAPTYGQMVIFWCKIFGFCKVVDLCVRWCQIMRSAHFKSHHLFVVLLWTVSVIFMVLLGFLEEFALLWGFEIFVRLLMQFNLTFGVWIVGAFQVQIQSGLGLWHACRRNWHYSHVPGMLPFIQTCCLTSHQGTELNVLCTLSTVRLPNFFSSSKISGSCESLFRWWSSFHTVIIVAGGWPWPSVVLRVHTMASH